MKKLKTFIAIAAVIAVMATILTSCNDNTANTQPTTTTTNATTVADDTLPVGTEVTLITQTDAQGNTVVVAKPTTGKVTKPDATQPTVKTTKTPAKTTAKKTQATTKKTVKTTAKKPQPTAAPKTTAKKTSAPARDEDDFSKMVYTTKTYSDGTFDIVIQGDIERVKRTDVFSRYTAYTNYRGEVKHHPSEGKRLYLVVGTQCTYRYLDDDGEWRVYL